MTAALRRWLAAAVVVGMVSTCAQTSQPVSLRSQPAVLTEAQVLELIEANGFAYPAANRAATFAQRYEPEVLGGVRVVMERNTGLMWQQAESPRVTWRELQEYVDGTNADAHAGFSDWRIPTVAELASLLGARRTGRDYLDDVLGKDDVLSTWTSDQAPDLVGGAWFVSFTEGRVMVGNRLAGLDHGRLVRTMSPVP